MKITDERNCLLNKISFEDRQKEINEEITKEEKSNKSHFKNFVQVNRAYYKEEDWLMTRLFGIVWKQIIHIANFLPMLFCLYQNKKKVFKLN